MTPRGDDSVPGLAIKGRSGLGATYRKRDLNEAAGGGGRLRVF